MKIAVACEPGGLKLGPFRKGSELSIWEIANGQVVAQHAVAQSGGCCGGLAKCVLGVDVVLCSGIGHGAMNHLIEQGTPVARPVAEALSTVQAVELWLSGAHERFFVASDDCSHEDCRPEHSHTHHP